MPPRILSVVPLQDATAPTKPRFADGARPALPADSEQMADGTTGGNYVQGHIPDLQVQPREVEDENK